MTDRREGGAIEHAVHKMEDAAGGLVGRAGASMTDRAEDFVESTATSDMYEIEAGRLAVSRAQREEVRQAAQKMIEDHTESSSKLEARLMPELRQAVPSQLDTRRDTMLKHLRQAKDEDFDDTYLDQQVAAHKEAVTLMHHFRDNGDNQALREFAADVAPVIEGHLDQMEQLAAR